MNAAKRLETKKYFFDDLIELKEELTLGEAVRRLAGISSYRMARLLGVPSSRVAALLYEVRTFDLDILDRLYQLSGLSAEQWVRLCRKVARGMMQ